MTNSLLWDNETVVTHIKMRSFQSTAIFREIIL